MKPAKKLKLKVGDHLVNPDGLVFVVSKVIDPKGHWPLTPMRPGIRRLVRLVELEGWYKVSLCLSPDDLVVGKLYCLEHSNKVFEYSGVSTDCSYLGFTGTGRCKAEPREIRTAGLRAACVYRWAAPPKPNALPDRDSEVTNVRQRRALFPSLIRRDGWVFAVPVRGSVSPVCTEHELTELTAQAESLIDARAVMVLDLADNLGQLLDNVKHMRWFVWEVACELSLTVKKWSKFKPLFGIDEKPGI